MGRGLHGASDRAGSLAFFQQRMRIWLANLQAQYFKGQAWRPLYSQRIHINRPADQAFKFALLPRLV